MKYQQRNIKSIYNLEDWDQQYLDTKYSCKKILTQFFYCNICCNSEQNELVVYSGRTFEFNDSISATEFTMFETNLNNLSRLKMRFVRRVLQYFCVISPMTTSTGSPRTGSCPKRSLLRLCWAWPRSPRRWRGRSFRFYPIPFLKTCSASLLTSRSRKVFRHF